MLLTPAIPLPSETAFAVTHSPAHLASRSLVLALSGYPLRKSSAEVYSA